MTTTKDTWGPRACPRPGCGAQPGESCRSATGKRTSLPHKERYPEGPKRIWGKQKAAQMEKLSRRVAKRQPLDVALRTRLDEQMAAYRERS